MNLGAIDIGSNAARVLITRVEQENNHLEYTKLKLIRYPIRLGFDSFLKGEISELKKDKLIKMLKAYKIFLDLYDVEDYLAFGTSALRNAANGKEIVEFIKNEIGIDIKIIDGNTEATIVYQTHFEEHLVPGKNYMYVDVGGGSTEIAMFSKGNFMESKSFKLGTVRLLHGLVGDAELKDMADWIASKNQEYGQFSGIGSGGNINTVFQLSGKRLGKALSIEYLFEVKRKMEKRTLKQRMKDFAFKEDRADVIIPALRIYTTAFAAADADEVFVPKIGLADGMIRVLAQQYD